MLVPSLRHPMVNAAATATLAALAPGRVAVSFGTGFTGRRAMGYRAITWSYMDSYIRAFRGLLRGDVVDLPTFHRALCEVDPAAERLVTYGTRQIGIAYDLSDDALQRDLGPMPKTPLVEGVRRTLGLFRRLYAEGRLDTRDLDG